MQIQFQNKQLVLSLSEEENKLVIWMLERNEHHVIEHVFNNLFKDRKAQMEHEEKESVWAAHLEATGRGVKKEEIK